MPDGGSALYRRPKKNLMRIIAAGAREASARTESMGLGCALAPLAAFIEQLAVDAKRRNRPRDHALQADPFAAFVAVAVCSVIELGQRGIDLLLQQAEPFVLAQLDYIAKLIVGPVDFVRQILFLQAQALGGLGRVLQILGPDFAQPVAEPFALLGAHVVLGYGRLHCHDSRNYGTQPRLGSP